MGFNAGAFAGALGTSGLNTYTRLQENSRQALKADQEAEVHAAWKKEQAQQAAMASNYGDTIGNSSPTQRTAIPGTMGQSNLPDGQAGPVAQMQDSAYSDTQKQADFRARNSAAGIDPMKTLQISVAARSDRSAQKMEEFQTWHTDMVDRMAKGDWASVVEANIGLYNKPSKGSHLNDGLTAKVIPSADGKSSSFVQYNKKGDVVASTPITEDLVKSKFEDLAFSKYQALDFKGGMDLAMKKEKLGIEKIDSENRGEYMRGMAGAAVTNANANANYKANKSFVDKLPEKDKFQLKSLDSGLQNTLKAFEANPTPEGQLRVGVAQLKLNKVLNKHGMVDDIYEGTGIPSPQESATQMMGNKALKPADIQKRIDVARQTFGKDYADEVAIALKQNAPKVPQKQSAVPTGSSEPKNLPRAQAIAARQLQSQRTTAAQNSTAQ